MNEGALKVTDRAGFMSLEASPSQVTNNWRQVQIKYEVCQNKSQTKS